MRHPVDGKHNLIAYTKEARAGADEDGRVAVLDDAGDELRLKQVRFSLCVDLAARIVKETGICPYPQTSVMVWKDGTDGIAGRFDAQQIMMKVMAIIAIDAVEPRTYPNVPAPVFGECADRSGDRHPGRIGGDEMPVVSAEEALAPSAEPEIAVAVCECVCREIGVEALWFAIRSECALAPSTKSSCTHADPQVLLIVDKKGADGVVRKAVAGRPVRYTIGPKTPDTVATGSYPEIPRRVIQQYRDGTVHSGSRHLIE